MLIVNDYTMVNAGSKYAVNAFLKEQEDQEEEVEEEAEGEEEEAAKEEGEEEEEEEEAVMEVGEEEEIKGDKEHKKVAAKGSAKCHGELAAIKGQGKASRTKTAKVDQELKVYGLVRHPFFDRAIATCVN